jgi:alpha-D-ribose 1-methylphosphonate 5-triphosphate diphosphatase
MIEHILTNARLVTAESVLDRATLIFSGEGITAVTPERSNALSAIDLDGDYVFPGFVELHTDNLEKHFSPRPGVQWPALDAVLAHDAQIAASGVTTVLDALAVGDIGGDQAGIGQDMFDHAA